MKTFFIIWIPQVFSWFGSQLVQFALIWWLTQKTNSAIVLAVTTIMTVLPQVIIGPFAGVLVDRWNRRFVIIISDGAIGLATVILILLYRQGMIKVWHIYFLMLVRAVGGLFHLPAWNASTALMVPEKHLTRIAGLNQTIYSVIFIIAPPVGALLVELLPMQGVLAIDVGTALLAIIPLFFIRVPQPETSMESECLAPQMSFIASVLRDMRSGLQFILGWRGLTILLLIVMLLNFLAWPLMSLVPILITKHFEGGAMELGWFQSALGIGGLLGGLLLSIWGGFTRRIVTMMIALILHGVDTAIVGFTPPTFFQMAMTAWFVVAFTGSIFNGTSMAMLQAKVPPEIQGRVFSFQLSAATAMAPIGLAVAGPVTDLLGPQIWFLLAGIVLTVGGIGGLFISPLMSIENESTEGINQVTHTGK